MDESIFINGEFLIYFKIVIDFGVSPTIKSTFTIDKTKWQNHFINEIFKKYGYT